MRFAFLITLLTLLPMLFIGAKADAQIDPSSALLLNSNRTDVREGGIDSGRYTIKPRSDGSTRKPRVHTEAVVPAAPLATPTPTPAAVATPVPQAPAPTPAVAPQAMPLPIVGPQNPNFAAPTAAAHDAAHDPVHDPVHDEDDERPAPAPRDERRYTLLEISFAPGYMYNDSKSTFAPRNYSVNAPTAMIDATVWVAPAFGVHTNFNSTINASVTDSLNNTNNTPASEQWFSAGLKARSFFGESRLAPTLSFGVDYREFEFRTPSDTILRNKLTTTGLILLLDAELPTSGLGSWEFGGEFGPALSHRETTNLIAFRSGDSPKTTSVGVHFGAHYRFDHSQSLFWKVSYGVEKNLFEGFTTINDPVTGLPQSNVSVTNSFTMFQLGYTWGN